MTPVLITTSFPLAPTFFFFSDPFSISQPGELKNPLTDVENKFLFLLPCQAAEPSEVENYHCYCLPYLVVGVPSVDLLGSFVTLMMMPAVRLDPAVVVLRK